MDRNEFKKLFAEAMEEYQKEKESEQAVPPVTPQPSKEEKPTSESHPEGEETKRTAKKRQTPPKKEAATTSESTEKNGRWVEITPAQVKTMYNLLRDIAWNLFDPKQPWDSTSQFVPPIMELIEQINPEEAKAILNEAMKNTVESYQEGKRSEEGDSSDDNGDITALFHEIERLVARHGTGCRHYGNNHLCGMPCIIQC